MAATEEFVVHQAIIHKVDRDGTRLSDVPLTIDNDIHRFFRDQIEANRGHKGSRQASFNKPQPGVPSTQQLSETLLSQDDCFVDGSKEIAKLLHKAIKGDKRIAAGDLLICTYTRAGYKSHELAILKIDPENAYVGEEKVVKGKIQITLRYVPEALTMGELQKCAFILHPNQCTKAGYDLIVRDFQSTRYGAQIFAASFFVKDFLDCVTDLNPADKTRLFVSSSYEWVSSIPGLSPGEVADFYRRVDDSLDNLEIDVVELAKQALANPQMQDLYVQHLRDKGLEELTFRSDDVERKKRLNRVTYEADDGLRVTAPRDVAERLLLTKRDEATNEYIIEIRTTIWRRK